MKPFIAALAIALLSLGACASDGSYDRQANDDLIEAMDAATQIINAATQIIQVFGH